ncbi:hypothetical protein ACHAW5_002159 [Stephanodiscus triporus]|uniref:PUL domain-containing protein n=1 Tax=Stephanodiscus triporus TaxID=2934178 RepID=A0ABD3Q428_9STRA
MGVMLRPLLEQMQITNNAPTNLPTGGNAGPMRASQPTFVPSTSSAVATSMAVNPWENIPAALSTPSAQLSSPAKQTTDTISIKAANAKPVTPLIEKQTALLSTDTGVVKICIDRLELNQEHSQLLSKLSDVKASWTQEEIISMHEYLRSVIDDHAQHVSYALMLLRLAVLKRAMDAEGIRMTEARTHSFQLVAKLLLEEKLSSLANRSMAWCVLSNAMGSTKSPDRIVFDGTDNYKLIQVVDRALHDCDFSKVGTSTSLRQSAGAFLYNASLHLTCNDKGKGEIEGGGNAELSEEQLAILLGCLEHLQDETDDTTIHRLLMAIGALLKSSKFGKTAANLVNDLGLLDEKIGKGKSGNVEALVREIAALLG